jgi:hypothetical protein
MLAKAAELAANTRQGENIMTDEISAGQRVLGRLVGRELTEAELSEVAAGGPFEGDSYNGTSTTTTANGCPQGDADVD